MNNIPRTILFSGGLLDKMKREGLTEEMKASLQRKADALLDSPTYAVVFRVMRAASGNPHDYCSIGTYWWPNPNTENGLPYIRRDGYGTPSSNDPITYAAMANKAFTLALAAYYLDEPKYAAASEKTLYDWHLNPDTYMTPHAEYAQSIPGICTGRGIGIIDFSMSSYEVFDAVGILEFLGYVSEKNVTELKKWYTEFTNWTLTSENGLTEDTEPNNHGTYFDVHMLSSAIFTGREALIKKICETAYYRRFVLQIEPDGSQPLELKRTRALLYSASNTKALALLANMAAANGYEKYLLPDARYGDNAVKKSIDFIYPYYVSPETFPYQEMSFDFPAFMLSLLTWADAHFPNSGYKEKIFEIAKDASELPAFPLL